jgi:hypothetical protein
MKLNDMAQESAGYVQPSINGVKLRLAALPALEQVKSDKAEKGYFDRINFFFKEFDGDAEFNPNMFSPYEFDRDRYEKGVNENKGKKRADTEDGKYVNMVNGNFGRLLHIFGCFMTKENYEKLQDLEMDDAEEFLAQAEALYDKDIFDLEFTSIIGYNGRFVQWPKFGDCLSSKHKPKPLVFKEDPKYFTLNPTAATPDTESRGSAPSAPRNTSVV